MSAGVVVLDGLEEEVRKWFNGGLVVIVLGKWLERLRENQNLLSKGVPKVPEAPCGTYGTGSREGLPDAMAEQWG